MAANSVIAAPSQAEFDLLQTKYDAMSTDLENERALKIEADSRAKAAMQQRSRYEKQWHELIRAREIARQGAANKKLFQTYNFFWAGTGFYYAGHRKRGALYAIGFGALSGGVAFNLLRGAHHDRQNRKHSGERFWGQGTIGFRRESAARVGVDYFTVALIVFHIISTIDSIQFDPDEWRSANRAQLEPESNLDKLQKKFGHVSSNTVEPIGQARFSEHELNPQFHNSETSGDFRIWKWHF